MYNPKSHVFSYGGTTPKMDREPHVLKEFCRHMRRRYRASYKIVPDALGCGLVINEDGATVDGVLRTSKGPVAPRAHRLDHRTEHSRRAFCASTSRCLLPAPSFPARRGRFHRLLGCHHHDDPMTARRRILPRRLGRRRGSIEHLVPISRAKSGASGADGRGRICEDYEDATREERPRCAAAGARCA